MNCPGSLQGEVTQHKTFSLELEDPDKQDEVFTLNIELEY